MIVASLLVRAYILLTFPAQHRLGLHSTNCAAFDRECLRSLAFIDDFPRAADAHAAQKMSAFSARSRRCAAGLWQ